MSQYEVILDTSARTVNMNSPDGSCNVTIYLADHQIPTTLVHALDVEPLESIPVVKEYPDVFPEDLPGLPPDHAVEFSIELLPGTAPVFRRPYKMSQSDLSEM